MRIKRLALVATVIFAFAILAYPLTAGAVVNWTKHPGNPVLTVGGSGSFDESGLERPMVIKDGSTFKSGTPAFLKQPVRHRLVTQPLQMGNPGPR